MKVVFTAENPAQAHIVKNFLDHNGIKTKVHDEIFYIGWDVPRTGSALPTVSVINDEEAQTALELLKTFFTDKVELKEDPNQKEQEWKCEQCGEMIEEQFTECWKCAGKSQAGQA